MKSHIFRQYDIRGIVGTDLFIEETYTFGRALAAYFLHINPTLTHIIIGRDNRIHSYHLEQELSRALNDSGLITIMLGVCTTPTFYFALHTTDTDTGVMITASHNGPQYNGFKICLQKNSVWGKELLILYNLYRQKAYCQKSQPGFSRSYNATAAHCLWLTNHFSHLKQIPLKIAIDCGHGTAGTLLPTLLQQLQWQQVTLIRDATDSNLFTHEANPVDKNNIQELITHMHNTTYDVGIGFDGDCDRMAAITTEQELIPSDTLLTLFAQDILKTNPQAGIVFDNKCSMILPELLQASNAHFYMTATGHPSIKSCLKKHNALLAGELSGHFIFADRYFGYDDGIYAFLRLIELLINSHNKKNLKELVDALPKSYATPELRLPCPDEQKNMIVHNAKQILASRKCSLITIDGIRAEFDYGWGIIRASHTQPAISVRCESKTMEGLQQVKQEFQQALINLNPQIVQEAFEN
jgi:phosphomannomutase